MLLNIIETLGIISFVISGVMVAMQKKLDPFGILIIAFVTSTGGGTLRDLLLGVRPIFWLIDTSVVYTIIITTVVAIILRRYLKVLSKSLVLFDTIGIALYTIAGIEKSLAASLNPIICVAIGILSACFGGVIRDILCRRIPVIFKKEIYATACIIGGSAYFGLLYLIPNRNNIINIISILLIIIIRILAVRYKLQFPSIYAKAKTSS
ncbi:trimeric intracellular cation channel family protein [Zhouia sp. PK063]|uniref:trimeric intracellular cation channel family protein n=1 Tax=Zhouia sp. PK063 TaxID=3373602 RepID=UPI00379BD61D